MGQEVHDRTIEIRIDQIMMQLFLATFTFVPCFVLHQTGLITYSKL
jgi:hypothetical protein